MDLLKLRRQLELHEGRKLKPYLDTVGKLTIGIGHNLSDLGISPAICNSLFNEDIRRVLDDLRRELPWTMELDDVRRRVFVDLCFNLGISKLLMFSTTLRRAHGNEWELAADALKHSKWYSQVGTRGSRLVEMLRTGVDPPELS